jgi:hypothetical protein
MVGFTHAVSTKVSYLLTLRCSVACSFARELYQFN